MGQLGQNKCWTMTLNIIQIITIAERSFKLDIVVIVTQTTVFATNHIVILL